MAIFTFFTYVSSNIQYSAFPETHIHWTHYQKTILLQIWESIRKTIVFMSFQRYWVPIIHLPKPTCSSLFSWTLRKGPIAKPSIYIGFTMNSPPHSAKTTRENVQKTKKIPTPPQVTENRPSPKTFVFVMYLPPKSNDWTPPDHPKRSQNLPVELPRTLRALRGPSRTPRTSWEPQNLMTSYI